MTVLSMSAGLLLILGIYIGASCGSSRGMLPSACSSVNIYFIFCKQLARNNVQMLVAHTVKKRLAVLTVIDYLRSSDLPAAIFASA